MGKKKTRFEWETHVRTAQMLREIKAKLSNLHLELDKAYPRQNSPASKAKRTEDAVDNLAWALHVAVNKEHADRPGIDKLY